MLYMPYILVYSFKAAFLDKERDWFPDGDTRNIWGWKKEYVNRSELPLRKKSNWFFGFWFFFLQWAMNLEMCVFGGLEYV